MRLLSKSSRMNLVFSNKTHLESILNLASLEKIAPGSCEVVEDTLAGDHDVQKKKLNGFIIQKLTTNLTL